MRQAVESLVSEQKDALLQNPRTSALPPLALMFFSLHSSLRSFRLRDTKFEVGSLLISCDGFEFAPVMCSRRTHCLLAVALNCCTARNDERWRDAIITAQ